MLMLPWLQPVASNANGDANADCKAEGENYINNCGYDGAFHALNEIYGDSLVVCLIECHFCPIWLKQDSLATLSNLWGDWQ